jgi:hypothetical protein
MRRLVGRSSLLLAAAVAAGALSASMVAAQTPLRSTDYPTVADLMNALIQPRHQKLGLAGAQQNWPLAAFAVHELKQSFDNTAKLHKTWRTLSLPDMFDSTIGEPIHDVFLAIQAKNAQQFTASYAKLTAGCNNCHEATNNPFIVIKVPAQSSFPNQDFAPAKP